MSVQEQILGAVSRAHRALFDASKGRVGAKMGGMPVIKVVTVGRKSGQPRPVMLCEPMRHEGSPVLVASKAGSPTDPIWFRNMMANPEVTVTAHGKTETMRARVATPEERAVLWPQIERDYKQYRQYQEKTTRTIPLVLLERPGS